VILERHSPEYVLARIRAGVLEEGAVAMLDEAGAGGRLHAEGLVHQGIEIAWSGVRHRIDLNGLTGGRNVVVYGQTEVTRDLMDARRASGARSVYEARDVAIEGFDGEHPIVRYRHEGAVHELACDYIAGCDGFHGVCRQSVPAHAIHRYERVYPATINHDREAMFAALPPCETTWSILEVSEVRSVSWPLSFASRSCFRFSSSVVSSLAAFLVWISTSSLPISVSIV